MRASRSFVDKADRQNIIPIVLQNIDRETYVLTDEAGIYQGQLRGEFLGHGRVNHRAGEYVRGIIHRTSLRALFDLQAWNARRLPALSREASAPLHGGIGFPL